MKRAPVDGWTERIRLSDDAVALISASRRGSYAVLPGAILTLTRIWWAAHAATQRVEARAGRTPVVVGQSGFFAGRASVEIAPERLEPWLEATLAAIRFSEGT